MDLGRHRGGGRRGAASKTGMLRTSARSRSCNSAGGMRFTAAALDQRLWDGSCWDARAVPVAIPSFPGLRVVMGTRLLPQSPCGSAAYF